MLVGTLKRCPIALAQTVNYLAYFIHLSEYAERVVAKEWRFNYCLDDVDTAANPYGEGGRINMTRERDETTA